MAKTIKRNVRFDSHHIRLKVGETEKKQGGYEYRWTTPDGKRHSMFAPTLAALRDLEDQIAVDKHDGIKADAKALTVNDCYNLWKDMKRGIKDSTFKNYLFMYETYVQNTFGNKRVVQVVKSDIKKFYNRLSSDRGLKVSTIDNIHGVLHQVFQVAVDDNYIRYNPVDNALKELRVANAKEIGKRKALTLEQQQLFLRYLKENSKYRHWYPVFYILTNTGLRAGELTGLRWKDVDLERGYINVNHTLVYYNHRDELGAYYSVNTPKTEAGVREVPMIAGVKEAFEMQREYLKDARIECKARVDGYDDFIFVNPYGNVQQHATLNKAIKRIIRDCNDEVIEKYGIDSDPVLLPDFSCHTLRHTFATRLCESGINVKVIQDILGHADIDTTMNIYIDVTKELKNRELGAFEQYLTTQIAV